MTANHPGAVVFILSAASGTGKSSLARALVESEPGTELSVSYTTRDLRTGEIDGRDYHFVSVRQFEQMIEDDEFVEYAKVYDCYYGTAKSTLSDKLESNISVVLDIDWQGAKQVINNVEPAVSVFLLPPSLEALRTRLLARGRDSEEVVQSRFKLAKEDMLHCVRYDYVVLNDDFENALQDLKYLLAGQIDKVRPIPKSLLSKLGLREDLLSPH